jgi:Arc/MetJ-type ribon-helix-helix transcriptional regulator
MKLVTFNLPEEYIKALDQLVKDHFYPNRAEAMRIAVKDLLILHGRFKPSKNVGVRVKIAHLP